jgi:hypothetical protein
VSVEELMIEYAQAQRHASDGAWGTWPVVLDYAGVRCTPQMARLHNAEHALLSFAGQPDLPEPMAAFIAADADPACPDCWLSSARLTNHPVCAAKIRRYFNARAALMEYGDKLVRDRLNVTKSAET